MTRPECRHCGTAVENFGDRCLDCEGLDDGLLKLTREDADRMRPERKET